MAACAAADSDSGSEEGPARQLARAKTASKLVRVLTVLAYLLSVSLAAILLSVYYVYVWQSPELPPEPGAAAAARRAAEHHQHQDYQPDIFIDDHDKFQDYEYGGGNTTVNINSTEEAPLDQPRPGSDDNSTDLPTYDLPSESPPAANTSRPNIT